MPAREQDVDKNQVDPKWAAAYDSKFQALTQEIKILKDVAVVDRPPDLDRSQLTTEEDAKRFDDMVDQDFYALDFKHNPPKITDTKNLYRVVHIWPEFKTSNSNEFIAKVVIEQWMWVRLPEEDKKKRQIITSFGMYAKDFEKKYKPTMIPVIAPAPE